MNRTIVITGDTVYNSRREFQISFNIKSDNTTTHSLTPHSTSHCYDLVAVGNANAKSGDYENR